MIHAKKPRDYSTKLNRKVLDLGLRTALSVRHSEGRLIVVNNLDVESPKTSLLKKSIENLGWTRALIVTGSESAENFTKASRNIRQLTTIDYTELSVYEILLSHQLVITQAAVAAIHTKYWLPSSESSQITNDAHSKNDI